MAKVVKTKNKVILELTQKEYSLLVDLLKTIKNLKKVTK